MLWIHGKETYIRLPEGIEEEADGDGEDAAEYDILSYAKTYLVPKQQELQMAWERRMEELKKGERIKYEV